MLRRKKIFWIGAGLFGVLWLVMYWAYRPALREPRGVLGPAAPDSSPSPKPSPSGTGKPFDTTQGKPVEPSPELRTEAIAVPRITVQKFTTPHFVSASPDHGAIASLRDTREVTVRFDAPLEASSRIFVFVGQKAVASNVDPVSGGTSLGARLATGAFELANLPRAVYAVYYVACFPGEGCFNGQYAFVGL